MLSWYWGAQSMPRKYHPHPYTTTSGLNHWYQAGWIHAFMWSSAAAAHLLQASMWCAFRDALLPTLIVAIWVTVGLLSTWTSLAILLWPLPAHWIATLFQTILCKPYRQLCVKIEGDQQFLKNSNPLVWHQQPRHIQSHLNHRYSLLRFLVWFSTDLYHVRLCKCM